MDPKNYLKILTESLAKVQAEDINKLADLIKETSAAGKTIYVFGNGGSGSNASHFVQDLLKCPVKDFMSAKGRIKAICLNDNMPVMLAYANDINYNEIFKQQLMNFCQKGDLVIGVSGSGKSQNVVTAIEYANLVGAQTFSVVGFDGGALLPAAQHFVHIKTLNMQIYEDLALVVFHAVISNLMHE